MIGGGRAVLCSVVVGVVGGAWGAVGVGAGLRALGCAGLLAVAVAVAAAGVVVQRVVVLHYQALRSTK